MLNLPLSLSLAGLTPDGRALDARASIAWAAGLGYHAVQLDGAAAGVRARELDRSARRDLASLLRRSELGLSGIDLWIPPAHFADPARADRAISATSEALELAADLGRILGSAGVVSIALSENTPAAVVEALAAAADRVGARLADHQWPVRQGSGDGGGGPVGIGIDPAALLAAGADPAAEVSRLAAAPASARLSDFAPGGRAAVGEGRLDVLAYQVALATKGYAGAVVVDLRGVREQEGAAKAAAEHAGS